MNPQEVKTLAACVEVVEIPLEEVRRVEHLVVATMAPCRRVCRQEGTLVVAANMMKFGGHARTKKTTHTDNNKNTQTATHAPNNNNKSSSKEQHMEEAHDGLAEGLGA